MDAYDAMAMAAGQSPEPKGIQTGVTIEELRSPVLGESETARGGPNLSCVHHTNCMVHAGAAAFRGGGNREVGDGAHKDPGEETCTGHNGAAWATMTGHDHLEKPFVGSLLAIVCDCRA